MTGSIEELIKDGMETEREREEGCNDAAGKEGRRIRRTVD